MTIHVILNYELFYVDYAKFHLPVFLIDVRPYRMQCSMHNTIMFFIEDPRINIELIAGFFEFFYENA
ncbi:MAG: hypothetical protein EBV19_09190, partial [Flavobacteriia bacterium]|nr:hypothetical protein [Flavobacteriia bacterium]